MTDQTGADPPEEGFLQQVRDALTHLYDHVALAGHPLMGELRVEPGEAGDQVRALRLLLMDAVEDLRPEAGTPPGDPAWRPYQVVRARYLLGKDFESISDELALGVRQLQRELRRGVAAVGRTLWEKRRGAPAGEAESDLEQEISRVAGAAGPIELGEVLGSAAHAVAPLARRRGIALTGVELVKATVIGDGPLLRQLLSAGLSWAVQSLEVGEVRVGARAGREEVLLTVSSVGRSAAGRPTASGPAGVSGKVPEDLLTLAQAQRARIECRASDEGEALCLWLPLEQRRVMTVAMVEDNPSVVALFSRYLAGRGYRLVAVEDAPSQPGQVGLPVLSRLLEIAPDAVILDVMMRSVDGWEVLQAIRAQPALRDTPVIVCTVLNDPALALAIGADAFLHKPVMPAQLLECLARVLATRQG